MDSQFKKRRLAVKHMVILAIFYVIFGILVITVAALSFVKAAQIALYGVMSGIGLIYLLIFPLGLSIYAIRIYFTISKADSGIKLTDLKMIRFLLATNVMFALLTVMAIIGVVMSIVGWDIVGEWIGIHRTIFFDLVLIVLFFMIVYLIQHEKPLEAMYGKCLAKLRSGKNKGKTQEEIDDAEAAERDRENDRKRREKLNAQRGFMKSGPEEDAAPPTKPPSDDAPAPEAADQPNSPAPASSVTSPQDDQQQLVQM